MLTAEAMQGKISLILACPNMIMRFTNLKQLNCPKVDYFILTKQENDGLVVKNKYHLKIYYKFVEILSLYSNTAIRLKSQYEIKQIFQTKNLFFDIVIIISKFILQANLKQPGKH